MDWIALLGSATVGSLITQIINILFVQRAVERAERRRWLRDARRRAYSRLATEVLSMGTDVDVRASAFQGYALAANAILLTEDDALAQDIERFFTGISNLYREAEKPPSDLTRRPHGDIEGAYQHLLESSRALVVRIRRTLHET